MKPIELQFDFPVLVSINGFNWNFQRIDESKNAWNFSSVCVMYIPFSPDFHKFVLPANGKLMIDVDNTLVFVSKIITKGGVKNESD